MFDLYRADDTMLYAELKAGWIISADKHDAMSKWRDDKGREIEIHTMSNKWLNNIRKKFRANREFIKPIIDEIKRRRKLKTSKP